MMPAGSSESASVGSPAGGCPPPKLLLRPRLSFQCLALLSPLLSQIPRWRALGRRALSRPPREHSATMSRTGCGASTRLPSCLEGGAPRLLSLLPQTPGLPLDQLGLPTSRISSPYSRALMLTTAPTPRDLLTGIVKRASHLGTVSCALGTQAPATTAPASIGAAKGPLPRRVQGVPGQGPLRVGASRSPLTLGLGLPPWGTSSATGKRPTSAPS